MMNIFKLFKQEEKGKSMLKAPPSDPKELDATLLWNSFWGTYDYVTEIACLRRSVNFNMDRDHHMQIEKMFIDALTDLHKYSGALVEDYKKTQEEKPDAS